MSPNHTTIETQSPDSAHLIQMMALWNTVYPEQLSHSDLEALLAYLKPLKETKHTLVMTPQEELIGWYFEFLRDGERWFAMLIAGSQQRRGLGRQLIKKAKKSGKELNGWVIDHDRDRLRSGEPYRSPLEFYLKNGFKVVPEKRLDTDLITALKVRWRPIE